MRIRIIVVAVAAALAAGCGAAGGGGSAPGSGGGSVLPPASDPAGLGTIAGRYVVQSHLPRGRHAHPGRGVVIGVFLHRVPVVGPVPARGPKPVAQSLTDAGGRFSVDRLRPGRYFLLPRGARALSQGRWARVRAGAVTQVRLIGCADCMRPLVTQNG